MTEARTATKVRSFLPKFMTEARTATKVRSFLPKFMTEARTATKVRSFLPKFMTEARTATKVRSFLPKLANRKKENFSLLGHKTNFSKYLLIGGSKVGGTKGQKIKI